jgi:hypothetical protein
MRKKCNQNSIVLFASEEKTARIKVVKTVRIQNAGTVQQSIILILRALIRQQPQGPIAFSQSSDTHLLRWEHSTPIYFHLSNHPRRARQLPCLLATSLFAMIWEGLMDGA